MSEQIKEAVRSRYGAVAQSNLSSDQEGVKAVAQAFGYSAEELQSIPAEANMGLSCGNPTAMAHLKEGETVVDLGSGGGLDVFLAAAKVGSTGRAIGIDMTPEMIERARRNAERGNNGQPFTNVEFHLATIDKLPLPDSSVDCVISNCVINLAPDKHAVFREIARVLKPGGRLAVSDIALKKELPSEIAQDVFAYVGCISGAMLIDDYRRALQEAGFSNVEVIDSQSDLNAYATIENQSACCSASTANVAEVTSIASASCCGTSSVSEAQADLPASVSCCTPVPSSETDKATANRFADLLSRYNVNDYAASVKVFAVK